MLELVKDITKQFFEKLCIETDNLEIIQEEENIYYVKIKTKDSSIIIWYSWKNLEAIRSVLKLILTKNHSKNIILHIEVNDYISKKEDKLYNFVMKKIDFLKDWQDIILPFFNSYERKKIHSYVCWLENDNIFTKSIWEWQDRRLHICKKKNRLTIDINWVGI